jgi:hypothetical protein
MDSSHLAGHAGTAGALFASIFVVATTTMRGKGAKNVIQKT